MSRKDESQGGTQPRAPLGVHAGQRRLQVVPVFVTIVLGLEQQDDFRSEMPLPVNTRTVA